MASTGLRTQNFHPDFEFHTPKFLKNFLLLFQFLNNTIHHNHHKGLERKVNGLENDPES